MADSRHDRRVFLVDPGRRGIVPLDRIHVSRRLARTVRAGRFEIRINLAFEAVIKACAAARPGREETWINGAIEGWYVELHHRGLAHSVEAWRDGRLAGGLYGVALGGAFFGESMFSVEGDASKVAFVHLVGRLRCGGFSLLDTQFLTPHLESLGAVEIARADYKRRLALALKVRGDFFRLPLYATGTEALHATSQAS